MIRTVDTRFLLLQVVSDTEEVKNRVRSKMLELRQEMAIVPTIVLHELYKIEFHRFGREAADLQLKAIETSGLKIERSHCRDRQDCRRAALQISGSPGGKFDNRGNIHRKGFQGCFFRR